MDVIKTEIRKDPLWLLFDAEKSVSARISAASGPDHGTLRMLLDVKLHILQAECLLIDLDKER